MKNVECRIIRKLAAVLLACLLLCGCAGLGDWATPLVEDYAIWRINGYEIVLVQEDADGKSAQTVIDSYIYRVTWTEDFICVQRTDPPETGEELPIKPEVDYYILRVSDGEVFGPYTEAEYKAKCKDLDVSDLPHWMALSDLEKTY